jgi:hypothetical protein
VIAAYSIDVTPAARRLGDGIADDLLDAQNMLTRGDLGNYAAITPMNVDL